MYKIIVRPILFMFSPEYIHKVVFNYLNIAQKIGLGNAVSKITNPKSLQMETTVCGIKFPNKIGIAAGLDKNASAYQMLSKLGFGHIEIGTVTPKPQFGNPKPRMFRLPKDHALINRMGFNNNGLNKAILKLKNKPKNLIVGGNIGKNTATPNEDAVNDYIKCFKGLYAVVDYITVNVSCPNICNLDKLQGGDELEKILKALYIERKKMTVYKPIFLKISPDLNNAQIDDTLEIIKKYGIDGIIAVNTTTLRQNLKTPNSKIEQIGNGGLSGKPLKERSLDIISYIHKNTNGKLPIIGVGGIETTQDALDKLNAGASLVQVFTGFIYSGPILAKRINKAIKNSLQM